MWACLPPCCNNNKQRRCNEFYRNIDGKHGFHKCPCGLGAYVSKQFPNMIFTGMRIESVFDRKKTKLMGASDFFPVFPMALIERSLNSTHDLSSQIDELAKNLEIAKTQNSSHSRFVNTTLHEIRSLNAAVKSQSEELGKVVDQKGAEGIEQIKYLQKNLFASSSLITMRLNAYDFQNNPSLVFGLESTQIEIHKKFTKVAHCLRTSSWKENALIHLEGNCYGAIMAHDVFEMLPFVILDNAIKYTPRGDAIYVTFFETRPNLNITVSNIGPTLTDEEKQKVFLESERGSNARKLTDGCGLGLYLAKIICDHYGIKITIKSGIDGHKTINKIPYSQFVISLDFPEKSLQFVNAQNR